jgi:hypothetical protein
MERRPGPYARPQFSIRYGTALTVHPAAVVHGKRIDFLVGLSTWILFFIEQVKYFNHCVVVSRRRGKDEQARAYTQWACHALRNQTFFRRLYNACHASPETSSTLAFAGLFDGLTCSVRPIDGFRL